MPAEYHGYSMQQPSEGRSDKFLIAEYTALRAAILHCKKELGNLLRYGLLSTGGTWAWLLTQPKGQVQSAAASLPAIVAFVLFLETLLVRRSIMRLGAYIKTVETHFALPLSLGWETTLWGARERSLSHRTDPLPILENLIWTLLIIGNVIGAFTSVLR